LRRAISMAAGIEITEVQVRLRSPDVEGSLIGWASCVINGSIKLDNVEIRRARDGRLFIRCPNTGSRGRTVHRYFYPITSEARRAFEAAILGRLSKGAETR